LALDLGFFLLIYLDKTEGHKISIFSYTKPFLYDLPILVKALFCQIIVKKPTFKTLGYFIIKVFGVIHRELKNLVHNLRIITGEICYLIK